MSVTQRNLWRQAIRLLVLGLCTTAMVAPLVFMIIGSLKPDAAVLTEAGTLAAIFPNEVSLQNYTDAARRVPFGRFLFNSALINLAIVVLGLAVNALAGYALARLDLPGKKIALALVMAVLVIPFEAIAIPLFYQLSAIGLRDSYLVQIVPFIANPLSIYLFYSFFLNLPRELEEAARLDGAGTWRTFITIIVPNAKPVFAAVTIVSFLFSWGAYLWPLLMTTRAAVRPLPLAIASFYTLPPRQWGDILAFGVMMVAPLLVIFIVFQRWFVTGVANSGMKG